MSWAVILTPGIMATTIHGITVVGDTTHGMADITAPIIPGGHPGAGTGVGARLGAGDPPGDGAHRGVGDRRGYRPQSSSGAYRPHISQRQSGAIGGGRYSSGTGTTSGRYGGNRLGSTSTSRPATGVSGAGSYRPGYREPLGSPSNGATAPRGVTRGRSSQSGFSSPTRTPQNNSGYTPSTRYNSNGNNSGTYHNNSGSFGGSRGDSVPAVRAAVSAAARALPAAEVAEEADNRFSPSSQYI